MWFIVLVQCFCYAIMSWFNVFVVLMWCSCVVLRSNSSAMMKIHKYVWTYESFLWYNIIASSEQSYVSIVLCILLPDTYSGSRSLLVIATFGYWLLLIDYIFSFLNKEICTKHKPGICETEADAYMNIMLKLFLQCRRHQIKTISQHKLWGLNCLSRGTGQNPSLV